jgi:hypothetical protein
VIVGAIDVQGFGSRFGFEKRDRQAPDQFAGSIFHRHIGALNVIDVHIVHMGVA